MTAANTAALSTWYSDGLRWIGSLFVSAADAYDQRRREFTPITHAEARERRAVEDYLDDLKYRVQSGYY